MVTDLLKDTDEYEREHAEYLKRQKKSKVPEFTIETLMGDMKRWDEGGTFEYSDYKIDKKKYLLLKDLYDKYNALVLLSALKQGGVKDD